MELWKCLVSAQKDMMWDKLKHLQIIFSNHCENEKFKLLNQVEKRRGLRRICSSAMAVLSKNQVFVLFPSIFIAQLLLFTRVQYLVKGTNSQHNKFSLRQVKRSAKYIQPSQHPDTLQKLTGKRLLAATRIYCDYSNCL